ncbi:hypothetical protein ANCCEY_15257, partial [Ancylostoma ceylanicum]
CIFYLFFAVFFKNTSGICAFPCYNYTTSIAISALKKTFQQSNARKAFKKLSEYFIMVNTEDDEEPFEEEYRPDGKYIPRLLFLDKNGDLLEQFKNKKAEYKNYAYYYSSPADIINSMKEVLRFYEIEVSAIQNFAFYIMKSL